MLKRTPNNSWILVNYDVRGTFSCLHTTINHSRPSHVTQLDGGRNEYWLCCRDFCQVWLRHDFDFAAKFDFNRDVYFAAEFDFGREFVPTKDNNSYNSLFGSDSEFDECYVNESMSRQKRCQRRPRQKHQKNRFYRNASVKTSCWCGAHQRGSKCYPT